MAQGEQGIEDSPDDARYYVYRKGLAIRLVEIVGWLLGWATYWLARCGFGEKAEALVDDAIVMRRANPGAVRAIGYLNGLRGLPAIRRGRLIIRGKIHETGPFENLGFFATYDVAAQTKRAS